MSLQYSHLLQTYIKLLEKHALPDSSDARFTSYVKYVNAFLSCFCKERCYLVGSTGEQLKLRRSKNAGDTDFLMCTGRLEIPIENIEERPDLRCYVKIRTDNLKQDICRDLTDGYLSADLLRELCPELFSFLRAVFLEVTSNLDIMPAIKRRVTTIGVPMKVGLGGTEFRDLNIEGDILQQMRSSTRLKVDRDAKVTLKLKKRWQNVKFHSQDMKMVLRILKAVRLARVPGSNGDHFGRINKFADDIDSVLKRIPLEQEQTKIDVNRTSSVKTEADVVQTQNRDNEKIKATYSNMSTRDFVPAIKIIGDRKPKCLVEWRKRVENANWPPRDIVNEIFNTDIFLVAREAPLKPDRHRDFCYSFNLAELKLAACLSSTQRRVYLILKSYLGGRLQKLTNGLGINNLKTYFLKTAFFWVCEREDQSLWEAENIIAAVKNVLHFIMICLHEKKLSHYFVNNNLFVGLEDFECEILQNYIQQIIFHPIDSIGDFEFIKESDNSRGEIMLNMDEIKCLSELKEDGGRIKHLDNLEDALIDIQRGFNESPRDAKGNVPIMEAINKVIDIFIDEERQKHLSYETSNISHGDAEGRNIPQALTGVNMPRNAAIVRLLNSFVTRGESHSINSLESNQRLDLLIGVGSMFRGGPEIIASIGGREGVRNVLLQTEERNVDPLLELKSVIGRYMSSSDDEEETLAQEIKRRAAAYSLKTK